jgi:hypothetical protein
MDRGPRYRVGFIRTAIGRTGYSRWLNSKERAIDLIDSVREELPWFDFWLEIE